MSLAVHGFAARQLADYRARKPGTLFAEEDYPHLTLGDASTVQSQVATLRPAEGEPVAGYKVGCTGPGDSSCVTAERLSAGVGHEPRS
jgi:2-keto-4-pentenoate hydratase